ncbi:MAG TPA: cupredoxin domain-containing protein [Desulfomonilia bacterium]|nr:cupredoxin domain-containing protein [Desulfomonilia bacterium]
MRKIVVNLSWMIVGMSLTALIMTAIEYSVHADEGEQTIKVTAQKFEYTPKEVTLKKGVPVVLELTSLDVHHGFNCPELGLRADIFPGKITKVRFVPDKAGSFPFHCDYYCGEGHEDMTGMIIVKE